MPTFMATVLSSPRNIPLRSVCSEALAALSVVPASPVLLTKNGPLGTAVARTVAMHCALAGSQSENSAHSAGPLVSALPRKTKRAGCPEGNFDGNQLLDGSMGLSPLCPGNTPDLHVRAAQDLHQSFDCLRPSQA